MTMHCFVYRSVYNRVGKKRYITAEEVKLIQKDLIENGGEGLDFKRAKEIVQKCADEKKMRIISCLQQMEVKLFQEKL